MSTPKEIGKIFAEQREKLNLTPEDVYRTSRIHPTVVRDIEAGAFEKINKPYLKSFLKKYADFLGIDTEKLIKQYESIPTNTTVKNFDIVKPEKKEPEPKKTFEPKKPFVPKPKKTETPVSSEKILIKQAELKVLAVYGLIGVFVLLIFVMVFRSCGPADFPAVQNKSVMSASAKNNKSNEPSEIAASGPVVLTLRARAEVWIQVTEGEQTLFAGIIGKGQSKTWRSNGVLTVWTGKADMLDFFVNERKVGVVAAGVVKHIKVSGQGVKVGENWISQLEE